MATAIYNIVSYSIKTIKFKKWQDHMNSQYLKLYEWTLIIADLKIVDTLALQGSLKIWTEDSTLILLNLRSLEILLPKFQYLYNYDRNDSLPNFEDVAQNLGLLRPFQVLDVFWWEIQIHGT